MKTATTVQRPSAAHSLQCLAAWRPHASPHDDSIQVGLRPHSPASAHRKQSDCARSVHWMEHAPRTPTVSYAHSPASTHSWQLASRARAIVASSSSDRRSHAASQKSRMLERSSQPSSTAHLMHQSHAAPQCSAMNAALVAQRPSAAHFVQCLAAWPLHASPHAVSIHVGLRPHSPASAHWEQAVVAVVAAAFSAHSSQCRAHDWAMKAGLASHSPASTQS